MLAMFISCFCERCSFVTCSSVVFWLMFVGKVVSVKVMLFFMNVMSPPPLSLLRSFLIAV